MRGSKIENEGINIRYICNTSIVNETDVLGRDHLTTRI